MRTIGKEQLKDIARGATFLGSAGGGSLKPGLRMIDENLPDDGKITIISVAEAMEDPTLTIATEYYGSPFDGASVSSVEGVRRAVEAYRDLVDGEVGHLVPIECGVQSTFVPVPLVAYLLDLPLVDADAAGRAVPGLTNYTTFCDVSMDTSVLASAFGPEIITIRGVTSGETLDELMSGTVGGGSFRGIGGFVPFALDGETLGRVTPIRGSFGLAEKIGHALRTAREPVAELLQILDGHGRRAFEIFRGEIVDVVPVGRPITSEASHYVPPSGYVTIRAPETQEELVLINQSENLIAWSKGRTSPLAMAPDCICYVTPDGHTFTNTDPADELCGKEVVVVGVESPALRAQPFALESFERCLREVCGYAGRNVPLSEIWG